MSENKGTALMDPMTVPAAAKELGKSKVTLYRWIDEGKILHIKFGGILFIPVSEVERLNKEVTTVL